MFVCSTALGKSHPSHVPGPIYKINPLTQQRGSTGGSREATCAFGDEMKYGINTPFSLLL